MRDLDRLLLYLGLCLVNGESTAYEYAYSLRDVYVCYVYGLIMLLTVILICHILICHLSIKSLHIVCNVRRELIYAPDDVTRSSPFFWAFRRAFPDSSDQIFGITDAIPGMYYCKMCHLHVYHLQFVSNIYTLALSIHDVYVSQHQLKW